MGLLVGSCLECFVGGPAPGRAIGHRSSAVGRLCQDEESGRQANGSLWAGDVSTPRYEVIPVGWVESSLTSRREAPRQGKDAPLAWIAFDPAVRDAISDLRAGIDILVLTWLDRAHRDVLRTRPRSDPQRPERGVFSTRSPDRPNPIGLHRVRIVAVDGLRIQVQGLEAIDGTPVADVKPVLDTSAES